MRKPAPTTPRNTPRWPGLMAAALLMGLLPGCAKQPHVIKNKSGFDYCTTVTPLTPTPEDQLTDGFGKQVEDELCQQLLLCGQATILVEADCLGEN